MQEIADNAIKSRTWIISTPEYPELLENIRAAGLFYKAFYMTIGRKR
jgi:hypothetical protein